MYLKIVFMLFFVSFWSFFSCQSHQGPCLEHYNCPEGSYCIGGYCRSLPADGDLSFLDGGSIVEKRPLSCKSEEDCRGKKSFHCFRGACVYGYLEFNFKKGHFILDSSELAKPCRSDEECESWQQCYLAYCRERLGLSSRAMGKIGDEGIFLGDYSYSDIFSEGGKKWLRIIMVGSFSEKRQERLIVEIAVSHLRFGVLDVDGKSIKAKLIEVRTDLVPVKTRLIAAIRKGKIKITRISQKVGERVAGEAHFIIEESQE